MKFLVVFALCAAVASAKLIQPIAVSEQMSEIKDIIAAINHPSTHPDTAAALQQMLEELLASIHPNPIHVGPAIVDGEYEPISVGPAIVDGEYEPISVGPAIVDGEYEPISVGPAIVDDAVTAPKGSPLVQIIVNVNPNSGIVGSPVIVEGMPEPEPVIVEEIDASPVIIDEIEPSPIIIVDQPEPEPENVIIVDQPEPEVIPPVVALPEILN